MWIALLILVVAVALVLAGCKDHAFPGYESAPYRVVRSNGRRRDPQITRRCRAIVETPMGSSGHEGPTSSFNRLFRFITGGNDEKQKIANELTPVLMSAAGQCRDGVRDACKVKERRCTEAQRRPGARGSSSPAALPCSATVAGPT